MQRNNLGQPSIEEIEEKFCTDMLCNAVICLGCPIHEMKAAQQGVQLTAFGAGGRGRLGNYLIRLGFRLAKFGGN